MNRPRLAFRDRVAVLVALPLVAVVLAGIPLLAVQLDTVRSSAAQADRARTALAVRPLLGGLATERVLALAALVTPPGRDDALLTAHADTDARAAAVRRDPVAAPVLRPALDALAPLPALRAGVRARTVEPAGIDAGYAAARSALTDALGTPGVALDPVTALVLEGERRADGEFLLVRAVLDPQAAATAAAGVAAAGAAADLHGRAAGDTGAAAALRDGPAGERLRGYGRALQTDPVGFAARGADLPVLLAEVAGAASVRGAAEDRDLAAAVARAAAAADAAEVAAAVLAAVFVALGAGVVAIGLRNARSVSRPLRRLAGAADEVAEMARRELLRVADSEDPAAPAPQLAAVNVEAGDELGELAGAFNRVQAVAALLLERQSLVRRNSAAMLAHVGRRTRTLVARQLDLVDSLEQGEQDADRLERLYRLDHLTSRLRRSADSLLVLASARDEEAVVDPQPLVTVVRTALSSIEDYRRVALGGMADVRVRPAVHADLVLLVAEILENAVSFSPPTTTVSVEAVVAVDGCRIEVVDHGVGIGLEEMARHNAAFLSRERLEVAPTDVLGLVVVGRIARRHGITVRLRPTPGGGVTAVAAVPVTALAGTLRAVPVPEPDPGPVELPWFAGESGAAADARRPGTAGHGTAGPGPVGHGTAAGRNGTASAERNGVAPAGRDGTAVPSAAGTWTPFDEPSWTPPAREYGPHPDPPPDPAPPAAPAPAPQAQDLPADDVAPRPLRRRVPGRSPGTPRHALAAESLAPERLDPDAARAMAAELDRAVSGLRPSGGDRSPSPSQPHGPTGAASISPPGSIAPPRRTVESPSGPFPSGASRTAERRAAEAWAPDRRGGPGHPDPRNGHPAAHGPGADDPRGRPSRPPESASADWWSAGPGVGGPGGPAPSSARPGGPVPPGHERSGHEQSGHEQSGHERPGHERPGHPGVQPPAPGRSPEGRSRAAWSEPGPSRSGSYRTGGPGTGPPAGPPRRDPLRAASTPWTAPAPGPSAPAVSGHDPSAPRRDPSPSGSPRSGPWHPGISAGPVRSGGSRPGTAPSASVPRPAPAVGSPPPTPPSAVPPATGPTSADRADERPLDPGSVPDGPGSAARPPSGPTRPDPRAAPAAAAPAAAVPDAAVPSAEPPSGAPDAGRASSSGAPPPPPGAAGLTRRVRGAQSPVARASEQPLLAPPVDAHSVRDQVHELEAGIDRASRAHRPADHVPNREEER